MAGMTPDPRRVVEYAAEVVTKLREEIGRELVIEITAPDAERIADAIESLLKENAELRAETERHKKFERERWERAGRTLGIGRNTTGEER